MWTCRISSSLLLLLLFFFFIFFVSSASAANTQNNPADQLVVVLNDNRTAHKQSALYDNPGLACIALQYIKAYAGNCDEVDTKKPADSEFAETFAPNCGVQASTLTPITDLLMKNSKSLDILYNKNHTEVGAAVSGSDGGAPYFWCVLFSSGQTNTSFALEGGVAKVTRPGCFSGASDDCNSANSLYTRHQLWLYAAGAVTLVGFALGL
ncbi:hypothetical protein RJ641_005810 [Dillenia turbinata]|uniref:Uncharacterized protein n=1 Tax=Dillenia turbinata TaxID=194707 RepID=A0AAN8V5S4_9MAGN